MRISAIPEVIEYLDNLVDILFKNNYFGFIEDAIDVIAQYLLP